MNTIEEFQLDLRSLVMTAERLALRPLEGNLKLAVDLVRALDGLDSLLQKELDQMWDANAGDQARFDGI